MWTTVTAIGLMALSLVGAIALGLWSQRRRRPVLRERAPNAPLGVHIEQAMRARMTKR